MNDETTTTYETRVTQLTVNHAGGPIFSEWATTIGFDDEGAGEFVVVGQNKDAGESKICIDKREWPVLRDAIDRMIQECRS